MTNPGSPHAVVLPGAQQVPGQPPPGVRAVELLEPFLDATRYASIAIVHGTGKRAPTAFDLAKQRMKKGNGVVWLPDPELLPLLAGPKAKVLRAMLATRPNALMTFASIPRGDVRHQLPWHKVLPLDVDQGFLVAGLA